MRKYHIFDVRDGLGDRPDVIIFAESPQKAVEQLYTNVKRDYTGGGDIVVRGVRGSFVYNGDRNDVEIVQFDKDGYIHTEFVITKKEPSEIISHAPIQTVYIPAYDEHDGVYGMYVKLRWVCPICGQPRGQIKSVRSYDGSRVLPCDGWDNPCGHVDKYDACRKEAAENGLNPKHTEGGGQ